jgi:hypothetical protein
MVTFWVLGFAGLAHFAFLIWFAYTVWLNLREALAETLQLEHDRRVAAFKLSNENKVKPEHLVAETRNMLRNIMNDEDLEPKVDMPEAPPRTCSDWVRQCIMKSHSESMGKLIKFDPETHELVLGLHYDSFMFDPGLTAYARGKLASLAPFLSDEERSFVAMGLRDAMLHLIVHCDTNEIHSMLLEFLIRCAFAYAHREREFTSDVVEKTLSKKPTREDEAPVGPIPSAHSEQPVGPTPSAHSEHLVAPTISRTSTSSYSFESTQDEQRFIKSLFDKDTFEEGLTAADFQRHVEQVCLLMPEEVPRILEEFLAERGAQRGAHSLLL